jgi:hypothetical protein
MDVREARNIKAKFYWKDKPKFTTYNEAFEFFYRVSQALNDHECILSNALSYTHDKSIRDSLLEKYLSFEDIKHKEFAKNLLEETIFQKLEKKKLLVFNKFETTVRQGHEDIPIRSHSSDTTNELSCIFDSIKIVCKNVIPIFLPDLKNNHLNEYNMLLDLEQLSYTKIYAKGEVTELHILDPRFWEVFLKYGVNEIEFINCYYFESRKAEESLEAYKSVMNADYNSIFTQTKRTRYLDTYISSVREIKDGVMKVKYHTDPAKLKYRKPGLFQIISEIKNQLIKIDEKAIDTDYYYQNNQ